MKRASSTTDQRLRSLVQKAARRGYADLVEKVATLLYKKGEQRWIRSRAVVITYEECWPLAGDLRLDSAIYSKIRALRDAAVTEKFKDAAGLGTLSHALSEGDTSVLNGYGGGRDIKIVAEAISRPAEFWAWARKNARTAEEIRFVEESKKLIASPTWPWDRAFVQAATYLAITVGVPSPRRLPAATGKFPYWVALDKHTPQGKLALKRTAAYLRLPYRQLLWTSFYLESAKANSTARSVWWERERVWRLRKAGLDCDAAAAIWSEAAPLIEEELTDETEKLKEVVGLESKGRLRRG